VSTLTVDSKFPRHTKVAPLSDAAFRLHVAAMSYCAEHETDGFVPESEVTTLTKHTNKTELIQELEEAKGPRENGHPLWRRSARGKVTGWDIHDYLEWNESHAALEAKRKGARSRMRANRAIEPAVDKPGPQRTFSELEANKERTAEERPARASLSQVENSKQESGSSGDPDPTSNRARGGAGGRAATIAVDWRPSAADVAFASGKGWDPTRMTEEAERFHAHHLAKGTLSKSWAHSWITWVLQGIRFDRMDNRASGVQRAAGRPGPSRAVQPDIANPEPPAKVHRY
jgi:hypothetical protein